MAKKRMRTELRVRLLRAGCCILLMLLAMVGHGPDPVAADLMQDLKNGVRMAGKLFGIDTISDVADLVAKGFSKQGLFLKPEANTDMQQQAASMMVMIWKLIGLDGSKLGALVMNALVFVAHVIASNLGTPKKPELDTPPKPEESTILQTESPLDWLINNPPKNFRSLLDSIKDGNLTDYLEADLGDLDQASPEDSGCIKLLVCKIKPFIWKMQNVVRERLQVNREGSATSETTTTEDAESLANIVYKSVPTLAEFQANERSCESRLKGCARRFG